VDTITPILNTIVMGDYSLIKGQTTTVTFTFSEVVSDFVAVDDILVDNGLVTALNTSDNIIFTTMFTPTDNHESTGNAITVADNTYTDIAGNDGTGASLTSYDIDTDLPGTTATPAGNSYAGTQIVTLTSDETATIYYTTDNTDPTTVSDSINTSGTIPDISVDTTVKFFAVDSAGNTEGIQTENYIIDATAPTLNTIVMGNYSLIKGQTTTVTFTFSEEVTGFVAVDDILVDNGLVTALNTSDNIIFTTTFTPTDNHESTGNAITVADNTYTDIAGNDGTGASSTSYDIDTDLPELAGSIVFANGGSSGADAGDTITITYTEALAPTTIDGSLTAGGSISGAFTVLLGKLGAFSPAGDREATGSNLSLSGDGITVVVTLGGTITGTTDPSGTFTSVGAISDLAGNSIDTNVIKNKSGNW